MVIEVKKYQCDLCGAIHDTLVAAMKCEQKGEISGKFCYDLHTKKVLCSHINFCKHFQLYGHIGKHDCGEFAQTKGKDRYWKEQ